MEELYTEGPANHGDPESCVIIREGGGEALTGARAGRAIEPRNNRVRGADASVGPPFCLRNRRGPSAIAYDAIRLAPVVEDGGLSRRAEPSWGSIGQPIRALAPWQVTGTAAIARSLRCATFCATTGPNKSQLEPPARSYRVQRACSGLV